mgnify:CR=1 FL=1
MLLRIGLPTVIGDKVLDQIFKFPQDGQELFGGAFSEEVLHSSAQPAPLPTNMVCRGYRPSPLHFHGLTAAY